MRRSPLVLVLALLAGCLTTGGGRLDHRAVSKGIQTGLTGTEPRVARDERTWAELWAAHASLQLPRPPAPEVDFAREMVVCVLLGDRPTGGYGIEVEEVRSDGTAVVVAARELAPVPDAVVPMIVTRPYQMLAVRRAEGDVRVEWRAAPPR